MSVKKDIIFYGVAAAGIYLLYKKFLPYLTGPGSLFDDTTSGIASMFPGTSPTVQVQGTVHLPDGTTAPISNFQSTGFNSNGALNITGNDGRSYEITSAGNGTYNAVDAPW